MLQGFVGYGKESGLHLAVMGDMEDIQQGEDIVSLDSCKGPFGCCMKEDRQGD